MTKTVDDVRKLYYNNNPGKEPAIAVGSAASVIVALFYLIMTLFPDILNDTQEEAIVGIIAILAPIVAAVIIRSKVWSPASVKEVLSETKQNGAT